MKKKVVVLCLFVMVTVLLVSGDDASGSGPEKSLGDLTGPWQLFVDDYLVEEKVRVKRTYHPLQKDPRNPILVSEGSWKEQRTIPYGTVLPGTDGKGYRMWYDVWDGDCHNLYATSRDGISWTKPSLGHRPVP